MPRVGKLDHAMAELEPFGFAERANKRFSFQCFQQAVERRPAETEAALQIRHRQDRRLAVEATQDVDCPFDRPHAVRGSITHVTSPYVRRMDTLYIFQF